MASPSRTDRQPPIHGSFAVGEQPAAAASASSCARERAGRPVRDDDRRPLRSGKVNRGRRCRGRRSPPAADPSPAAGRGTAAVWHLGSPINQDRRACIDLVGPARDRHSQRRRAAPDPLLARRRLSSGGSTIDNSGPVPCPRSVPRRQAASWRCSPSASTAAADEPTSSSAAPPVTPEGPSKTQPGVDAFHHNGGRLAAFMISACGPVRSKNRRTDSEEYSGVISRTSSSITNS